MKLHAFKDNLSYQEWSGTDQVLCRNFWISETGKQYLVIATAVIGTTSLTTEALTQLQETSGTKSQDCDTDVPNTSKTRCVCNFMEFTSSGAAFEQHTILGTTH